METPNSNRDQGGHESEQSSHQQSETTVEKQRSKRFLQKLLKKTVIETPKEDIETPENKSDTQDQPATPEDLSPRERFENSESEPLLPPSEQLTSNVPIKLFDSMRTDPIEALETRHRRLERLTAIRMPEIHIVGELTSIHDVPIDSTEGLYCRWKIDFGKAWDLIGGELSGQTQVGYHCPERFEELEVPLNHPIDVHVAEAGLQGFGAGRISVQCFRLDFYGRSLLVGYGFTHLPTASSLHRLEVPLWRPAGSLTEEWEAMLLGEAPALLSPDPLYESAWRDRCRLVTVAGGKVVFNLFVMTRHREGSHTGVVT